MTPEEFQEYESLSPVGKDYYNMGKREHPEWSHKQAIAYVCICSIPTPPSPGPPLTLKEIFTAMMIKAEVFMQEKFPRIYSQVKEYFSKTIQWLKNAIDVTINKIIDFFK